MAFIAKKDYCGCAISGKLECSSDQMGASSSDVTAADDGGTIVASTNVSGGKAATNGYDIKADVPFTSTNIIKLGKVNTVDSAKYMLTGVTFGTASGSPSNFSASATDVESSAETGAYYALPGFTLPKTHKAAMLFSEATITGAGCSAISVAYSAGITGTVDRDELGAPNSSGVSAGFLTSTITIQQSASTVPTVTAGTGWHISNELTQTNSKGAYPTWTVSLTKYLERTEPSE